MTVLNEYNKQFINHLGAKGEQGTREKILLDNTTAFFDANQQQGGLLTVRQFAQFAGYHHSTIQHAVTQGKVTVFVFEGAAYLTGFECREWAEKRVAAESEVAA